MDSTGDCQGRWVVHGERTLYDSPWVRLGKADITTPSGNRFEHHTVTLPSAAMIAALNQAEEHVLMSYRHRFVPDVWGWELPEGFWTPRRHQSKQLSGRCWRRPGTASV